MNNQIPEGWLNNVIQGDCLELMKELPDKCVDLVLTDPPYGIRINGHTNTFGMSKHTGRKKNNDTWDNHLLPGSYFQQIFRVSRNQIIWGANYYWGQFYATQCYIVWDKRGMLPDVPFCDTEFAWTSFTNRPSKRYLIINHGFVRGSSDIQTSHPTQKPSELFSRILRDFTNEQSLVVDPFLGSGTTAVACLKENRNFIGFEIEAKYVEIAKKRIQAEKNQLKLF